MNPLLDLDATKLSLGIETTGGIFTKLIERNTKLPTENSFTISTNQDNQTLVEIAVLQGERGMAEDNYCLGRFALNGISPAPRGFPQVEITFAIDINRVLKVSAIDRASGKREVFVTMLHEPSKEDIENLVKDAQINSEIDKQKCALVEVQNYAESLCFSCSKALEEYNSKINNDLKTEIEILLHDCKVCLVSENVEVLRSKAEDLSKALQAMYEQMQCGDGGGDEVSE